MPWAQFITQWLHVFFAISWFGGTLFWFGVVGPALRESDPVAAAALGQKIGSRTMRFLAPAGALTIIFGLLRATVFGPIRSWDFFSGSAYGSTLAIAIVLAIVIAVLGGITGKVGNAIGSAAEADRPQLISQVTLLSGLSIVGFVLALTCMELMRYGL